MSAALTAPGSDCDRVMKRNVTVQLDDEVIRPAKVLATKRGTSVSGLVAAELTRLVAEDEGYEEAAPFPPRSSRSCTWSPPASSTRR